MTNFIPYICREDAIPSTYPDYPDYRDYPVDAIDIVEEIPVVVDVPVEYPGPRFVNSRACICIDV